MDYKVTIQATVFHKLIVEPYNGKFDPDAIERAFKEDVWGHANDDFDKFDILSFEIVGDNIEVEAMLIGSIVVDALEELGATNEEKACSRALYEIRWLYGHHMNSFEVTNVERI